MRCIKCQSNTNIIDSRKYYDAEKDFDYVNRKRCCESCGHKFITIEISEETWINIHNSFSVVSDEQQIDGKAA